MKKSASQHYDKERVLAQARQIRLVTRLLTALLASTLGVHSLLSDKFVEVTSSVTALFALNLSKVIWFVSLTYGSTYDTNLMEKVALRPSQRGILSPLSFIVVLLLAASYAFLWISEGFKAFSIFLCIFWTINFGAWWYLTHWALPDLLAGSRNGYLTAQNLGQLERLDIVEQYLCGKWQVVRFCVGYAMIGILLTMSFSGFHVLLISNRISGDFIIAISLALFLAIVLGWMWVQRIRTTISLDTIEELDSKYLLTKKRITTSRE